MTDKTERLNQIGKAMQAAWGRIKRAQARAWGDWMVIGEGLMEGRNWAMDQAGTNRPEGKGYVMAYGEWLRRYRVDDMDKSDRAKILQIMEERAAVEEWRATLTDTERRNLNNPTVVWRRWTAATRVRKPKAVAYSAATEMSRARRTVEEQEARIKELQEEIEDVRENALGSATADQLVDALLDLVRNQPTEELHQSLSRLAAGLKEKQQGKPKVSRARKVRQHNDETARRRRTAAARDLRIGAESDHTFRDSRGSTIGTAQTDSQGTTTFRDERGKSTGTVSCDSSGTVTFRDARGRTVRTAFPPR